MSETIKTLEEAKNYVRPEAKAIVKDCLADKTTQNGYGRAMAYLSNLDNHFKKLMLIVMVEEGYPLHTAQSLARIYGIS